MDKETTESNKLILEMRDFIKSPAYDGLRKFVAEKVQYIERLILSTPCDTAHLTEINIYKGMAMAYRFLLTDPETIAQQEIVEDTESDERKHSD